METCSKGEKAEEIKSTEKREGKVIAQLGEGVRGQDL